MRMILVAAIAAALVGCNSAEMRAKSAVKEMLNDPSSAEFSGLFAGKNEGDVCGFVNAKNRMGAYVGKTPFFYRASGQQAEIVRPVERSDFKMYWLALRSRGDTKDEHFRVWDGCNQIARLKSVCGDGIVINTPPLCSKMENPVELLEAMRQEFGD